MRGLTVSEIFGPTVQGEGPGTGTPSFFLRLGTCPVGCVWCDTAYTWDWTRFDRKTELEDLSFVDLTSRLDTLRVGAPAVRLLVVTGGEPMVQKPALRGVLDWWLDVHSENCVEVETAGIVPPYEPYTAPRLKYNVSPKLASSGVPRDTRLKPEVLREFVRGRSSCFKFVVSDEEDWREAGEVADLLNLSPGDVWVMPQGRNAVEVTEKARWLVEKTISRGWRLSLRVHTVLWGDRRGV